MRWREGAAVLCALAFLMAVWSPVFALTIDSTPDPVALAKARTCGNTTWKTDLYALTGVAVTFDGVGDGGADCGSTPPPGSKCTCDDYWSYDLDTVNDPKQVCDTIDYEWSYMLNGQKVVMGTTSSISYSFPQAGDYTVTLRVTDSPGNNNDNTTDPQGNPIKKAATSNVIVHVRDLTVTLTGATGLQRGQSQTFTATVTPTAQQLGVTYTYDWTFAGGPVQVQQLNGGTTWGGTIVIAGNVEVKVTGCTKNATANKAISVTPRPWADDFSKTVDTPTDTPHCPKSAGNLGHTIIDPDAVTVSTQQVASGPNAGYQWVTGNQVTWDNHVWRHSALNSPGHPFYEAQADEDGECTHAQLKELVEIHEGIVDDPAFTSHWAQGVVYIIAHPINPWMESVISHCVFQTLQVFMAGVGTDVQNRISAVCSACAPEPANKYNCAIDFEYTCEE